MHFSLNETILLHLDGTPVIEKVIGRGQDGIVVERGQYAVKLPRIIRYTKIDGVPVDVEPVTPNEGECGARPPLTEVFQYEKAIYQRLGNHYGIVRCYNLESTDISIEMELMGGNLRHYLANNRPEQGTRLAWLATIAHTMAYIHEHRTIITDLCLENLLLDKNDATKVKICDFSESALMPLEWDFTGTDEFGFSILTDIGQFGAVMYEVVTGHRCTYDLTADSRAPEHMYTCPRRNRLPSTNDVWLGRIIHKCWTQAYRSARQLASELEMVRVSRALRHWRGYTPGGPVFRIATLREE